MGGRLEPKRYTQLERTTNMETNVLEIIYQKSLVMSVISKVICNALKGHGNGADFLGFLQKSVRHRFHFEPFRFGLRICGDIRNRKTTHSPTRRVGESTRMPIDQWWAKLLRLLTVNSLSYFVKIKY